MIFKGLYYLAGQAYNNPALEEFVKGIIPTAAQTPAPAQTPTPQVKRQDNFAKAREAKAAKQAAANEAVLELMKAKVQAAKTAQEAIDAAEANEPIEENFDTDDELLQEETADAIIEE